MFFPKEEKPMRMAALKTLMDMMEKEKGKKLGSLKKPVAASMTIEKIPSDALDHGMDDKEDSMDDDQDENDEMNDDQDISEDDKAKIAELYHKYC